MPALIIASFITPCHSAFPFTTSERATRDEATENDINYAMSLQFISFLKIESVMIT